MADDRTPAQQPLAQAIARLMAPLVRLLIAKGLTYPALCQALKAIYLSEAEKSLTEHGETASVSRLSIITGLQRKDIKRLQERPRQSTALPSTVTFGARLIGIWTGDKKFRSKKGKPLSLPRMSPTTAPDEPSFDSLVRTLSTDVRSKAVLDEWLRLGVVSIDDNDLVTLNANAFVTTKGVKEKFYYLGRNVSDHIATCVRNILGTGEPLFERAVYYDHLTAESIAALRESAREHGMKALLAVNEDALKYADADENNPHAVHRIALGLYHYDDMTHASPADDTSPAPQKRAKK
jgi:hypothetical protein